MLRRKSILALQKVTKELTKENVNNYRDDERVDDPEVPLYSAIKLGAALGEADEVEKILRLHPNVFLGVKDEDQQYFSKTAIGLARPSTSCNSAINWLSGESPALMAVLPFSERVLPKDSSRTSSTESSRGVKV